MNNFQILILYSTIHILYSNTTEVENFFCSHEEKSITAVSAKKINQFQLISTVKGLSFAPCPLILAFISLIAPSIITLKRQGDIRPPCLTPTPISNLSLNLPSSFKHNLIFLLNDYFCIHQLSFYTTDLQHLPRCIPIHFIIYLILDQMHTYTQVSTTCVLCNNVNRPST